MTAAPETVDLADSPDCRTLGEAIFRDLHAAGVGDDASTFVENLHYASLDEAAGRGIALFRERDPQSREDYARALIEAVISARKHEGWLAIMAGRDESAAPLDVEIDWWFDDPIIDAEKRRIGMTMRVNRQRFRFWMTFAEVLLFAHTLVSQIVRKELSDHPASPSGRSPS